MAQGDTALNRPASRATPDPDHECIYVDVSRPSVRVASIVVTDVVLQRHPVLAWRIDPRRYMRPGRLYRCCRCLSYVRIDPHGRPIFEGFT